MKHNKENKRFTVLGVLVLVLLALLGLAAMGIVLHKQDLKNNWKTENIITLEGEMACLPHKNVDPGQPQTLECATGVKVNDVYYALKYEDGSSPQVIDGKVSVTGVYNSPMSNERYDIAGTLDVKAITKK